MNHPKVQDDSSVSNSTNANGNGQLQQQNESSKVVSFSEHTPFLNQATKRLYKNNSGVQFRQLANSNEDQYENIDYWARLARRANIQLNEYIVNNNTPLLTNTSSNTASTTNTSNILINAESNGSMSLGNGSRNQLHDPELQWYQNLRQRYTNYKTQTELEEKTFYESLDREYQLERQRLKLIEKDEKKMAKLENYIVQLRDESGSNSPVRENEIMDKSSDYIEAEGQQLLSDVANKYETPNKKAKDTKNYSFEEVQSEDVDQQQEEHESSLEIIELSESDDEKQMPVDEQYSDDNYSEDQHDNYALNPRLDDYYPNPSYKDQYDSEEEQSDRHSYEKEEDRVPSTYYEDEEGSEDCSDDEEFNKLEEEIEEAENENVEQDDQFDNYAYRPKMSLIHSVQGSTTHDVLSISDNEEVKERREDEQEIHTEQCSESEAIEIHSDEDSVQEEEEIEYDSQVEAQQEQHNQQLPEQELMDIAALAQFANQLDDNTNFEDVQLDPSFAALESQVHDFINDSQAQQQNNVPGGVTPDETPYDDYVDNSGFDQTEVIHVTSGEIQLQQPITESESQEGPVSEASPDMSVDDTQANSDAYVTAVIPETPVREHPVERTPTPSPKPPTPEPPKLNPSLLSLLDRSITLHNQKSAGENVSAESGDLIGLSIPDAEEEIGQKENVEKEDAVNVTSSDVHEKTILFNGTPEFESQEEEEKEVERSYNDILSSPIKSREADIQLQSSSAPIDNNNDEEQTYDQSEERFDVLSQSSIIGEDSEDEIDIKPEDQEAYVTALANATERGNNDLSSSSLLANATIIHEELSQVDEEQENSIKEPVKHEDEESDSLEYEIEDDDISHESSDEEENELIVQNLESVVGSESELEQIIEDNDDLEVQESDESLNESEVEQVLEENPFDYDEEENQDEPELEHEESEDDEIIVESAITSDNELDNLNSEEEESEEVENESEDSESRKRKHDEIEFEDEHESVFKRVKKLFRFSWGGSPAVVVQDERIQRQETPDIQLESKVESESRIEVECEENENDGIEVGEDDSMQVEPDQIGPEQGILDAQLEGKEIEVEVAEGKSIEVETEQFECEPIEIEKIGVGKSSDTDNNADIFGNVETHENEQIQDISEHIEAGQGTPDPESGFKEEDANTTRPGLFASLSQFTRQAMLDFSSTSDVDSTSSELNSENKNTILPQQEIECEYEGGGEGEGEVEPGSELPQAAEHSSILFTSSYVDKQEDEGEVTDVSSNEKIETDSEEQGEAKFPVDDKVTSELKQVALAAEAFASQGLFDLSTTTESTPQPSDSHFLALASQDSVPARNPPLTGMSGEFAHQNLIKPSNVNEDFPEPQSASVNESPIKTKELPYQDMTRMTIPSSESTPEKEEERSETQSVEDVRVTTTTNEQDLKELQTKSDDKQYTESSPVEEEPSSDFENDGEHTQIIDDEDDEAYQTDEDESEDSEEEEETDADVTVLDSIEDTVADEVVDPQHDETNKIKGRSKSSFGLLSSISRLFSKKSETELVASENYKEPESECGEEVGSEAHEDFGSGNEEEIEAYFSNHEEYFGRLQNRLEEEEEQEEQEEEQEQEREQEQEQEEEEEEEEESEYHEDSEEEIKFQSVNYGEEVDHLQGALAKDKVIIIPSENTEEGSSILEDESNGSVVRHEVEEDTTPEHHQRVETNELEQEVEQLDVEEEQELINPSAITVSLSTGLFGTLRRVFSRAPVDPYSDVTSLSEEAAEPEHIEVSEDGDQGDEIVSQSELEVFQEEVNNEPVVNMVSEEMTQAIVVKPDLIIETNEQSDKEQEPKIEVHSDSSHTEDEPQEKINVHSDNFEAEERAITHSDSTSTTEEETGSYQDVPKIFVKEVIEANTEQDLTNISQADFQGFVAPYLAPDNSDDESTPRKRPYESETEGESEQLESAHKRRVRSRSPNKDRSYRSTSSGHNASSGISTRSGRVLSWERKKEAKEKSSAPELSFADASVTVPSPKKAPKGLQRLLFEAEEFVEQEHDVATAFQTQLDEAAKTADDNSEKLDIPKRKTTRAKTSTTKGLRSSNAESATEQQLTESHVESEKKKKPTKRNSKRANSKKLIDSLIRGPQTDDSEPTFAEQIQRRKRGGGKTRGKSRGGKRPRSAVSQGDDSVATRTTRRTRSSKN